MNQANTLYSYRQSIHPYRLVLLVFLIGLGSQFSSAAKPKTYNLDYYLTLLPGENKITVTISIDDAKLVKLIKFRTKKQHGEFEGDGTLSKEEGYLHWEPGSGKQSVSYDVTVNHKKGKDSYDALMTDDWAIFRGDDIIPAATVRSVKKAKAEANLHFTLPESWTQVDTGWQSSSKTSFKIDNPERSFDRPVGWIIAGKLGTRRDFLSGTELSISAPVQQSMRRMDALTLINQVWPDIKQAFQSLPPKVLIVGAGNPMWRGGLSSPNSFFMHADRPIVSENGTSTLLHELTHVITRIRGKKYSDWISEGLAEFYSIELMRRSGAMNEARHKRVLKSLTRWSKDVTTLRLRKSTGPVTARSVLLFYALDKEIRERSRNQYSIDDVTRALTKKRTVSLRTLRQTTAALIGGESESLQSHILK